MRVAVFGSGAVGSYLGSRFAAARADVHLIARGAMISGADRAARGLRPGFGECVRDGLQNFWHLLCFAIVSLPIFSEWQAAQPSEAKSSRPLAAFDGSTVNSSGGVAVPLADAGALSSEASGICGIPV